ncbi:MAG: hypothetical protein AAF721_27705 [Myxococcota bacterium]
MSKPLRLIALCLALAPVALGASGCKNQPTIPGTEIPDTEDNRDILRVVEKYRVSFVRRDAAGVLTTAHPTYFDTAGTDDPSDDLEYKQLGPALRERMAQLESVRFTIDYLEIDVVKDRAVVKVWVDASFRLKPIVDPETGEVRVESSHNRLQDHAMFELLNESGAWRITRGL